MCILEHSTLNMSTLIFKGLTRIDQYLFYSLPYLSSDVNKDSSVGDLISMNAGGGILETFCRPVMCNYAAAST